MLLLLPLPFTCSSALRLPLLSALFRGQPTLTCPFGGPVGNEGQEANGSSGIAAVTEDPRVAARVLV